MGNDKRGDFKSKIQKVQRNFGLLSKPTLSHPYLMNKTFMAIYYIPHNNV